MSMVYVLKIRHHRMEYQILMFDSMQKVYDAVFEFYGMESKKHKGLDGFQHWLSNKDYGYFEVTTELIR